jgi:hypothetical protein
MLSELVDTSNGGLLLFGIRRSRKSTSGTERNCCDSNVWDESKFNQESAERGYGASSQCGYPRKRGCRIGAREQLYRQPHEPRQNFLARVEAYSSLRGWSNK